MATRSSRPTRTLLVFGIVIAVMYLAVASLGNWKPKLGLDLQGGTRITLQAKAVGGSVTSDKLNQAKDIISSRVNGTGVSEAEVTTQGNDIVIVEIPGKVKASLARTIGKVAQLRFRIVAATCPAQQFSVVAACFKPPSGSQIQVPTTTAGSKPTYSVTPPTALQSADVLQIPDPYAWVANPPSDWLSKTASFQCPRTPGQTQPTQTQPTQTQPTQSPTSPTSTGPTSTGPTSTGPTSTGSGSTTPPPTGTTTPPTTTAASSGASLGEPSTSSTGNRPAPHYGPARAPAPAAATTPSTTPSTPTVPTAASPGATTTGSTATGSTTTPPSSTTGTPSSPTPPTSTGTTTPTAPPVETPPVSVKPLDVPSQPLIACGVDGLRYLLGPAVVEGTDVNGASSGIPQNQLQYAVTLSFNGSGSSAFGAATTKTAINNPSSPTSGFQMAIVLDGEVISDPTNQEPINGGQAIITGGQANPFTQASAASLANALKFGALPLTFTTQDVTTEGPELASGQLDAGIVAGIVGLLLVVGYCLLYYRGLGFVVISSLVIAGLITYACVLLLGHAYGFTLTLPGIAGLIVAVGITADSFIVYFERLRDEVRDGKTLRTSVETGWVRARSTILAADAVSMLAALVLFIFAIGVVKGFAFALGLTTFIDVFVVFFFTKPVVTLLARTKFFGQGHKWSGLDRQHLGMPPLRPRTRAARGEV